MIFKYIYYYKDQRGLVGLEEYQMQASSTAA